jgi:FkbM family methyltransferase
MRKWLYYATSLVRVLIGFRHPLHVVAILLGPPLRGPAQVQLRSGARFVVRSKMDVWCLKETWLDRFYERYAGPAGKEWLIVDIGAGIGDFTVLAAQSAGRGTVLAFEPFPDSYRLLDQNLKLNGCTNVRIQPMAVSGYSGLQSIGVVAGDPLQTTTHVARQQGGAIAVPSVSLESILNQLRPNVCDLVKMDCEGAEFDILLSSPSEVVQRIRRIVLEYHDWPPNSHVTLVDRLISLGYCVKTSPNAVHSETGYLFAWKGVETRS